MLLRASGESQGEAADPRAVTDPAAAAASGVPDAELLLAFADAVIDRDPEATARARDALRARAGDAATVDAAAVIANFERMVRVADGTGIPLDGPVAFFSADLRSEIGIDRVAATANAGPAGRAVRWASRALQPLLRAAMRRFGG